MPVYKRICQLPTGLRPAAWLALGWLAALLLALPRPAQAQPERQHWKFGNQCGLSFPAGGGAPTLDPFGPGAADEACASISDANGVLQCYTDGQFVWDRADNVMPGGLLTGSNYSATQGATLLRQPGQQPLYYLFTVDADGNNLRGGLRYTIVDMSRRAGLGDVTAVNSVPVSIPGGGLVTEKLTAVLHANGRDYWILVHGWLSNNFYAYLLGPNGLSAAPVVSGVGAVHAQVGPGNANSAGYLRASPDGRTLAVAQSRVSVQLFDFDNATGQVSAARTVPAFAPGYYGLEFSADNSKLYVSGGAAVFQLDLANGLALATISSGQGSPTGLERGPDGQVYVANYYTNYLSVVRQPNLAGAACDFVLRGVVVSTASGPGQMRITNGLPHFPNAFSQPLGIVPPPAVCAGNPVGLAAFGTLAGAAYTWNFGDPATLGNTATGPTAQHTYARPGTYTVTLSGPAQPGGPVLTVQQQVQVLALPTLSLGVPRQTLCAGQLLVLQANAQPAGTTYRWQDGSTAPTYPVRAGGRYVLTVTSPGGCTARDSVQVDQDATAPLVLQASGLLCPGKTVALGPSQGQPVGSQYQWQDGSTGYAFVTGTPGTYTLRVTAPSGCERTASLVLAYAPDCVGQLPTIITPDQDGQNDTFVLDGLVAADWSIALYNRWGRELLRQASYDNAWRAAGQPAGIYYYLLTNRATGRRLTGWVEVVR